MKFEFEDLISSWRRVVRRPGVTIGVVLCTGVGIGAVTSVFALFNGLLFQTIPGAAPESLVRVLGTSSRGGLTALSYPDYLDFSREQEALAGLAATQMLPVAVGQEGGVPAMGETVSENYFEVLGVDAAVGRTFRTGETRGSEPVVVVRRGFWDRHLEGPPQPGVTIRLNGDPFRVIGVVPERFTGTFAGVFTDVWLPLEHTARWRSDDWRENRERGWLNGVGRLRAGVTRSQAEGALVAIAQRLEERYPDIKDGEGVRLLEGFMLYGQVREGLYAFLGVLIAASGLVLLIACGNVANLLLAVGTGRQREIAMRMALGAKRSRVWRQLLVESLSLGLVGGMAGLGLAYWITRMLPALNPIASLPLRFDLDPDFRVAGFVLMLALLTAALFGVLPALRASRPDLVLALKEGVGGTAAAGPRRALLKNILIGAQVALCVALLVNTGLFLRSLHNAAGIDPGFDTDHSLATDFDLGAQRLSPEAGLQVLRRLTERIAVLPEAVAVTVADFAPLDFSTRSGSMVVEGRDPPAGEPGFRFTYNVVGPEYFATTRIPILQGRPFTRHDDEDSPLVAIVNQEAARRFWPGESPIGQRIRPAREGAEPLEIVGVARLAKYRTLGEEPRLHLYLPLAQNYQPQVTLLVRTAGDASGALLLTIEREARAVDPRLHGFFARTLVEHLGISLLPARLAAALSAAFGSIALLLAAVGIYGVVAHLVSQRTREIGVRMALGARASQVLRLVVKQALVPVAVGAAAGVSMAYPLARLASGFLYEVDPGDPRIYGATVATIGLVALVASWIPAWRAATLDPRVALRHE